MDLKEVLESTGEALSEAVGNVTSSVSPGLANLAETQIGKQIASIVTTAGAKAEEALEKGHHVRESVPPLPEPAADLVSKAKDKARDAKEAVHPDRSDDSGTRKALIVGGVVVAAAGATAAGVVVYRRRKAARSDDGWTEDGEGAVVTPLPTPPGADSAAPESGDQPDDEATPAADQTAADTASFASQLDAEADHFVSELVDNIDEEQELGPMDLDYAIELDAEADHFAQDFVDQIVVTDDDVRAEEELEKQA